MLKKQKILIVIMVVIIIILVILFITIYKIRKKQKYIQEETQRVMQYTSITDFKTIEEVFIYLDSEYIGTEKSKIENVDYIIKGKLKYNAEYSVKNYYQNLIQYSAYVLDYKNFYIIDENKNINIFVFCNSENKSVVTYYINDKERYFENLNSEENMKNFSQTNIISVKVSSEQLKKIISSNWNANKIDLGEKESYYRNYNIYFDEGYEIRNVNNKVFNIIFTEKYNEDVLENIKVGMSKENIEKVLGKPEFESNECWGYKTEKFYIFFNKEQISIYPVVEYNADKVIDIIEESKDLKDFSKYINELRNTWQDYDKFENTENKVIIQYTLKGIKFKYDSTAQKGVILYNNYTGNVDSENHSLEDFINENTIKLPQGMYFENSNLVFEHEKERVATLDDYSPYRNYSVYNIVNTSSKYKVNKNYEGKVMFVSINKETPNYELRDTMDYGIWLDDYTFIYSIKNKGMYLYDLQKQEYVSIIEGIDMYKILSIDENKLYYDDTFIILNR